MAWEAPWADHPGPQAAADLSAKQYYAVYFNSAGKVALVATAGDPIHGVLQDKPESGKTATVLSQGVSKVLAGGTFAVGDPLTTDADGKFVKAYGADAVAGIALEAGVADQVSTMYVLKQGRGEGRTIAVPIKLSKITGAGDVLSALTPGYAGRIKSVEFFVTDPVTTAAKLASLNLEIGATDLTGGVVALTSANCTPLGARVAGSAVTAANVFTASDTISVEASAVTAFVEGEGVLMIHLG